MSRVLALLMALGLAACGATPGFETGSTPPRHQLTLEELAVGYPIEVSDPWEGFNRGVYKFNALFDEFIFLPVVDGYEFITPVFVQQRVSNFFSNLSELRNGSNGLLQLRPDVAGRATIRFAVNSTAGVLGLFDVAGSLGAFQQQEDFGQTLGWYGSPPGPFMMLPVLGPSNVRDTTGLVVDTAIANLVPPISTITERVYFNPAVYLVYAVDQRHLNRFRYYGTGSPFEYDLIRFLYTKKREAEILR
jgi:phospholipid-binding lipoprotein MlaA